MARSTNLYACVKEVRLPDHPLDISRMTDAQLDAELEKGYVQLQAGRAVPARQAFDAIRKELRL